MSTLQVGRNDPCPCGSGKKFKKCCMLLGSGYLPGSSAALSRQPVSGPYGSPSRSPAARSAPPQQYSSAFDDMPPEEADGQPESPPLQSVPPLPVEVGLHYTYPEPFGQAEVNYILPAGRTFVLADGKPIINDYLKPGMRVVLKDGEVATITAVNLYYEPPERPSHQESGLVLSRVVGTIKHKGLAVTDVNWPGYTATSSPDHLYYSVSRQSYVPAQQLQVGEFLRTDNNLVAPVQAVSKPRYGMIDLYNVEVEHFHNYHVGKPDGSAVLVHNGTEYIKTPAEARETLGGRLPQEGSNGTWVKGEAGNGVWRSTDIRARQAVAARTGGAVPEHVDITFRNGYPVFSEHIETLNGVKGSTRITLDTDATASLRTRTDRDFSAANKWLAEQWNNAGIEAPGGGEWTVTQVKDYLKDQGMQWHHHEDMTTMQLLRRDLHDNIPHIGGRSLMDFSFDPPLPFRKPK